MELWGGEGHFALGIAKGFIYKRFGSLCCVYLGAASIP